MDDTKIIAENIVRYRVKAGWSRAEFQRRLAETKTPIGIMPLRQIEAGKRDLRLPEAITIAKLFNIPVEFLAIEQVEAGNSGMTLDSIVTFAAAQATQAAQAAEAAQAAAAMVSLQRAYASDDEKAFRKSDLSNIENPTK